MSDSTFDTMLGAANFMGNTINDFLNFSLQKQNLDYQKALQQELFKREDTAYQRRIEDMKAAGINPYSITGGAGAGSVVSTQAPQKAYHGLDMKSPDYLAAMQQITAMKYQTENMKLQNENLMVDNRIKNQMADLNDYKQLFQKGQWLYDQGYRGLKFNPNTQEFTWDSRAHEKNITENFTSLDKAFGQREYSSDLIESRIDKTDFDKKYQILKIIIESAMKAVF